MAADAGESRATPDAKGRPAGWRRPSGRLRSITDTFDSIFGERKVPLRGERQPVLVVERPLGVDEGNQAPVTLPPPALNPEWPQAGGTIGHAPGHPALGPRLSQAWRTSVGTGTAYRRRLIAPPWLPTAPSMRWMRWARSRP
ncbi:hypothetical protein ACFQY5_27500 [Paeniroseomonas aquatica]|uniref:hypothetical protein n=1 Tax=Paeniroseomonas aquatica TaxID=373043 RepID=UPI003623E3F0